MIWLGLLVLGLVVGAISGALGIGGGLLVVPALTLLFGFTHQRAVGTSLGMLLPPIGIFAFLTFWRAGQVDVRAAALLAAAFALGAWGGSIFVSRGRVDETTLRTFLALFLLYAAGNMLFRGQAKVWAVVQGLALAGAGAAAYGLCRVLARRWDGPAPSAAAIYRQRAHRPDAHDYEI